MSPYDEVERAVVDMRERFLSIGERIAGLLATLARQIDAVPAQAGAPIRYAADQIAGTQQRLRTQLAGLPTRPEERYQIMRSLLQAQQGALQQLTIIVEQHAPQEVAFAHRAQVSFAQDGGEGYAHAPHDGGNEWPAPPRSRAVAGHASARARARAARRPPPRRRGRGATLVEVMSSRALAMVGIMVLAAAVAYFFVPGTDAPHGRDHGLPATTAASDGDDATMEAAARPNTSSVASGDTQPLPPGIVFTQALSKPVAPSDGTGPGSGPTPRADLPAQTRLQAGISMTQLSAPGAPRIGDPAPEELSTGASAPKPATSTAASEGATAVPVRSRFVAVVFTHRDRTAALGAFADLQQRYPSLLTQRNAEAQPTDIADKGTWHRLVVLPAGSRQSAIGLCDQLEAAGYDRCWVKAY